jgi:hypothetical protein
MNDLERVGIDMQAVTEQLTQEGVQKFGGALAALLEAIRQRRVALATA